MQLTVPAFGESISEVLISEWLVAEGASVAREANLVVIETDKITSEVPAPMDCRVTRILKQAGETATVGEVIAELEELAAGSVAAAAPVAPAVAARPAAPATPASPPPGADPPAAPVMPAAERLMAEQGLAAGSVAGSGPGGRVLKEDVLRHLEAAAAAPPAPAVRAGVAPPRRRSQRQLRAHELKSACR